MNCQKYILEQFFDVERYLHFYEHTPKSGWGPPFQKIALGGSMLHELIMLISGFIQHKILNPN